MINNTQEIMDRGIACLVQQLGVLDAEVFIATLKRESFDYTEWRKTYFGQMKPGQFHEEAIAFAEAHPYQGKGKRL